MDVKILNFETVIHPPTWCEIDLKALAYNFEQLQKLGGQKHVAFLRDYAGH